MKNGTYRVIYNSFWTKKEIRQLSDSAKLMSCYLLTSEHTNMLGCFRLPDLYVMEDLCWNHTAVKKSFHELTNINFIVRDEVLSWILINEFLNWNQIQNPKQAKGVMTLFESVPSESIVWKPLIKGLLSYGKHLEPYLNRLHTLSEMDAIVSKPYRYTDTDTDTEQDTINMSGCSPDATIHKENSIIEKQKTYQSQAIEVLQFLNEKTGKAYRPVDSNIKLIIARLKTGATVMDCRQVIAKKTREWKGDAKMAEYLRPATLFNPLKFEQYMGELVVQEGEASNEIS